MNVKRGPDGRGVGELRCTACHGKVNLEGEHLPPGTVDWRMPSADRKMAFQGITVTGLCLMLKDPLQNGGRQTAAEAVRHIAADARILWAWAPGNGRSTPPLGRTAFLRKMNEWAENGAACPE
jgi:hypothetical protein